MLDASEKKKPRIRRKSYAEYGANYSLIAVLLVRQGFDAGQLLAFEEFEACAAAG